MTALGLPFSHRTEDYQPTPWLSVASSDISVCKSWIPEALISYLIF